MCFYYTTTGSNMLSASSVAMLTKIYIILQTEVNSPIYM